MDCKGRVLVELADNDFSLSCGAESTIKLVEESESQIQEFLLLLLSDSMPRNDTRVVFVGKDMEDEAMMLQIDESQDFLCWVPFNVDNILVLEITSFEEREQNVFSLAHKSKKLSLKTGSDGIKKLALSNDDSSLYVEFRLLQAFLDNDDSMPAPAPSIESGDDNGNDISVGEVVALSDCTITAEVEGSGTSASPIPGPHLSTVHFTEGPLGMTLRRRGDGIIYIHDVEGHTQADRQGVQAGDEVWSVGVKVLGNEKIDKERWVEVVQHIKTASRPLEMVLRRYNTPADISATSSAPSVHSASTTPTSQLAHSVTPSGSTGSVTSITTKDSLDLPPPVTPAVPAVSTCTTEPKTSLNSDTAVSASAPSPESAEMSSLTKLAARLIFNEKGKGGGGGGSEPTVAPQTSMFTASRLLGGGAAKGGPTSDRIQQIATKILVKEGRRLLRHGMVSVPARRALWNVQNKKTLFLFSDILLITVSQGDKFLVETTIDLATCKVNIRAKSDLLDPTIVDMSTVFELLYPGGSLIAICDDKTHQMEWVQGIFKAICDVVGEGAVGWKHQYLLGTMHSAVLSRDAKKVSELLESCLAGELEFLDMEKQDDEGYTPLHYSCLLRLTNITKLLHESNADVTVPDSRGLTALHWAAMQLDHAALEMLCTHVFNVDIVDYKDRTPLYLACVEGRDVQGCTDVQLLKKCVECLMQAGANPNLRDREGLTVLHYVSASWQWQVIEAMMNDANTSSRDGISRSHVLNLNLLSDIDGWNALHYACGAVPLKRMTGEGHKILQERHTTSSDPNSPIPDNTRGDIDAHRLQQKEGTRIEDSIGTLRILLRHGVYPNMKDHAGRRAIDIMAANISRWTDNLQPSLLLLMAHGTRIDDSLPEALKSSEAEIVLEEGLSMWAKAGLLNGDELGLRCVRCSAT